MNRVRVTGVLFCMLLVQAAIFQHKSAHAEDTQSVQQVADSLYMALKSADEDVIREILDPGVLIFESGGVESSLKEYASHHMGADC